MHRHALGDEQWELVRAAVPARHGPAAKRGDRLFIDAVLYRAKTGIPWRDLPERFGPWKTVYNRFTVWSHRGFWAAIFGALQFEVDEEGVMIDASIVRAPGRCGRKRGISSNALGRSRGGFSTKVHALVDTPIHAGLFAPIAASESSDARTTACGILPSRPCLSDTTPDEAPPRSPASRATDVCARAEPWTPGGEALPHPRFSGRLHGLPPAPMTSALPNSTVSGLYRPARARAPLRFATWVTPRPARGGFPAVGSSQGRTCSIHWCHLLSLTCFLSPMNGAPGPGPVPDPGQPPVLVSRVFCPPAANSASGLPP